MGPMPKYLHISLYVSLDRAPNILKKALLRANCKECLIAELIGHASVPQSKTGKHLLIAWSASVCVSVGHNREPYYNATEMDNPIEIPLVVWTRMAQGIPSTGKQAIWGASSGPL